ncbi:hypothetical protein H7I87_00480 [Mycobacterium timonense]|uniref:Uncharacterized protein n=2 Tax=Mycobacterium TaxID=1763 RepID=A0AAW5RZX9_MYCBC|nr:MULTISPECIES: hypothetical protein [Mycobacterium avium complex (MAC)]MCV6988694.1 hypothetical protein [Mycobacterium bouchedurhonense]MCV6993242.1 hypothetical protein [Mycobacterium timonense]MDV3306603.1 hypothetical protein [Mycobacterium avium subsp. hominissuis]ORA45515.1 hypothetical protein BST19_20050 [Mycobacterium bouchedurhonense]
MTEATIHAVARMIDPAAAQLAVASAFSTLGSLAEWDSETIEWVTQDLLRAFPTGLPTVTDQDEAALEFWQAVVQSR